MHRAAVESIRQQVTATGQADTASALKSATAHGFADPKGRMVSRIQIALMRLDTTLSNAV